MINTKENNEEFGKTACARICPNSIVITIASVVSISSFLFIFPELIQYSDHKKLFSFDFLFSIGMYLMFIWCWLRTAVSDPGRVSDDLKDRGVYRQISSGDIPNGLRHLPICMKCRCPRPPGAAHCSICDYCVLRYDHHCGVTGQCIADKNFKAFILSFFYGGILGILISFSAGYDYLIIGKDYSVMALVLAIYALMLGLMVLGFGIHFFLCGVSDVAAIDKIKGRTWMSSFCKMLNSFGEKWYMRIIPLQKHSTCLAWPGVNWNEINLIPL